MIRSWRARTDAGPYAGLQTMALAQHTTVSAGSKGSHPDLPHLTLLVFEAVLEVVCVSFPGYVIARQGMFDAEMQKFAANLNVALFTPCLSSSACLSGFFSIVAYSWIHALTTEANAVFTKLASQLNSDKLAELAIIPLIFVVQTLVSYLSALLVARLFRFSKRPRNFVIAMGVGSDYQVMVFGNSNSLPISLVLSLSHTINGLHWDRIPGDNDNEVAARGILYLLIFQQLGQLVRWTWGYNVLLAPPESPEPVSESPQSYRDDPDSETDIATKVAASTVGVPEPNGISGDSSKSGMTTRFADFVEKAQKVVSRLPRPAQYILNRTYRFLRGLWSFMNPPLWAMLVAIVVASIPRLQRLFFTPGTFVENSVTSAIRQSGGVAVPLILVVLGGNLARNTLPSETKTPSESREETKLLVASLISRMLLPMLIMGPLLAVTAKFVPVSILDDPIFIIVCFLISGAPSALQLAQICQINNVYMGAMSRLLFQSYVVWILPSTLVLVTCALEVVEWAT